MLPTSRDLWSEWLLIRRHGGSDQVKEWLLEDVKRFRDRVLDAAMLNENMTLLDIGAGDGLVALGALSRMNGRIKVVMVDVSSVLLDCAKQSALELGFSDKCSFILNSAEQLDQIASNSIDVVTTRSALAYVGDKAKAATEFYRVLKTEGRISLAEPVFWHDAVHLIAARNILQRNSDNPAYADAALMWKWKSSQLPTSEVDMARCPITNYNERGLLTIFEGASFQDVRLEVHVGPVTRPPQSWDSFLNSSPHPESPTHREVMESCFSCEERRRFETILRPMVEIGKLGDRETMVYLTARKSGSRAA